MDHPAVNVDRLRQRAERGDRGALYRLADHLASSPDAETHRPETLALFRSAAAKGEKRAQFALGAWYLFGVGVRKNYKTAYRDGDEGVRRNLGSASKWLTKAAAQGHKKAARCLRELKSVRK